VHARRKMQTAALVLSLVASVAGTGPYCEEWCGKNTCNLYEYCGACIAANNICSKTTRPCLASSCSKSTFDTKHRMCTQASDSECGNKCTCDDYIKPPPPPLSPPPPLGEQSPSAPPPTPAMPPVTCDTDAIATLKSKLSSMVAEQRAKNFALSAQVYDPQDWEYMPPFPPSPPPPTPATGMCVNLFGQCGGKQWGGATCCYEGECKVMNPWYSQCRKD